MSYYPDDIASDIGGYEQLHRAFPTQPQADDSVAVTSGTSPALIDEYVSDAGDPGITIVPAGK